MLLKQEAGIARKTRELDELDCPKTERAAQLVIRLHTTAKQAVFHAAITQRYALFYKSEAQGSHCPWTLHIRFALWAARAAYAHAYGAIAENVTEQVAADVCAFAGESEEGTEAGVEPGPTAKTVLVTSNQKDDYSNGVGQSADQVL